MQICEKNKIPETLSVALKKPGMASTYVLEYFFI